jgi:hypothetical protein
MQTRTASAPTVLRLVPFVACLGVLATAVAIGSSARRVGAGMALTAILLSVTLGGRRARVEAGAKGSAQSLAVQIAAGTWVGWLILAVVYGATLFSGAGPATLAGLGVVVGVALLGAFIHRRLRELDKEVALRATSIAFFVTMASAAAYAQFETLDGAPHLSMWLVWTIGMGTWLATTMAVSRHYR